MAIECWEEVADPVGVNEYREARHAASICSSGHWGHSDLDQGA